MKVTDMSVSNIIATVASLILTMVASCVTQTYMASQCTAIVMWNANQKLVPACGRQLPVWCGTLGNYCQHGYKPLENPGP